MPIIFSTIAPARPACPPPARVYFEAPDDALLARVTEKVAERMGRHLSYTFHDEAPGGVTPIILEDVGPSAPPVETTVVNYPHAAGCVPGSLLLKEYPSGRSLTDNGRGHLNDQDGRFVATVDYETGTIHQPQALSAAPNGWESVIDEARSGLQDSEPSAFDNSGYRAFAETVLDAVQEGLSALAASPTPPAEQQAQPDECFPGEPKVAVPQGFRDGQSTTKQEE